MSALGLPPSSLPVRTSLINGTVTYTKTFMYREFLKVGPRLCENEVKELRSPACRRYKKRNFFHHPSINDVTH